MQRFAITSLGCKANQYDAAALSAFLTRHGWRQARRGEPADLLVVATCCVTTEAMRKSRQALGRMVRRWGQAAVLVAGCYSDYDADRLRRVLASLGVPADRYVVAGHHTDLAEEAHTLLARLSAEGPRRQGDRAHRSGKDNAQAGAQGNDRWMSAGDTEAQNVVRANAHTGIMARRKAAVKRQSPGTENLGPIDQFPGHQRAFVKVQDGCDAFCSYCIVPFTRARVWSRSRADILAECRRLIHSGHPEIVLSGVFLGAYGRDTAIRRRWPKARGSAPLVQLLRRVAGLEGLWRVRLSSLEPGDVTDDLLGALASLPGAAPHLHLPLQSGSETILRRMNRQYTAEGFRRTVDRVREALDRPALTTDVIAGFPGETEEDFSATLDLARYAGFAKVHAFPFSAIEGTAAWLRRKQQPPRNVVRTRLARLADVEAASAQAYRDPFVGEVMEGVIEKPRAQEPTRQAMTDRYLTVTFAAPPDLPGESLTGQVRRFRITSVTEAGLAGEMIE